MKDQHDSEEPQIPASDLKRIRQRLLYWLSRRPYTIQEMRRKLRLAGFSSDSIEKILDEAQTSGWLDDQTYAKLWVEDRLAHKPKGKALLKRELRAKGVGDAQIESALGEASIDEESLIGQLVAAQTARHSADDPAAQRRKLYGYLQRRGFSPDAIRRALKKWEESDDAAM